MAEAQLVDEHANGCTVCQAVAGPFVVYALAGWTVNTVNGPIQVDTDIVLCAHRDGREGCIGQAARQDGYVSAAEYEATRAEYAQVLESHAALEQTNAELEASQNLREDELAKKVAAKIIAEAG